MLDNSSYYTQFQGADSIVTVDSGDQITKTYSNLVNTLKTVSPPALDHDKACKQATEIIEHYHRDTNNAIKQSSLWSNSKNEIIKIKNVNYQLHAELIRQGDQITTNENGIPVVKGQPYIDGENFNLFEPIKGLGLSREEYFNQKICDGLYTFINHFFNACNSFGKFALDFSNVKVKVDHTKKRINLFITDLAACLFSSYRYLIPDAK
jgi:hypothetical protein